MRAYKTFLKLIGMFLLVPVIIGVVITAGFIGFGIDFSNSFGDPSGQHPDSMYMIVLPLLVLIAVGWVIYSVANKRHRRRKGTEEQAIRQQVYREQHLGTTPEENIRNLIALNGSMTANELAQQCHIDDEAVVAILRQLLQQGVIRQDITESPPVFSLV